MREVGFEETELARSVLAWSQFFDELIEKAQKLGRVDILQWSEVNESRK